MNKDKLFFGGILIPANFLLLTVIVILWSGNSLSQGVGCDEGVIRMPDRNGTIQICSSLAAKVPQLSKQLSEVSKSLGTQQQQLNELTRLVKGLNGISRDLSNERQTQLLVNLAKELERSSNRGVAISKRDLEVTIDRVDDLNETISKIASTPSGTQEIKKAMSSDLGLSISRLEFSSAESQLDDIRSQLKSIRQGVSEVRQDTMAIRQDISKMQDQSINAMNNIAAQIRLLNNQGGIVLDPKTYAENYHNARIYAQRGEIDLAMKSYEKVVQGKIIFADPIQDMVSLSKRAYGQDGAKKYLQKSLSHLHGRPEYFYALQLLDDENPVKDGWVVAKGGVDTFPPFGYVYYLSLTKNCSIQLPSQMNRCYAEIPKLEGIDLFVSKLNEKFKSGEYLNFYIDSNKASRDVESAPNPRILDSFRKITNFKN